MGSRARRRAFDIHPALGDGALAVTLIGDGLLVADA
jgi:hypothetical protein